ncbi:unknown [Porphyromonas sp. CAG:1061]|nr:unknown [Porphyromonas sp. CAG:1061]
MYSFKSKTLTRKGDNRTIYIGPFQNYPFGYCRKFNMYRILHV